MSFGVVIPEGVKTQDTGEDRQKPGGGFSTRNKPGLYRAQGQTPSWQHQDLVYPLDSVLPDFTGLAQEPSLPHAALHGDHCCAKQQRSAPSLSLTHKLGALPLSEAPLESCLPRLVPLHSCHLHLFDTVEVFLRDINSANVHHERVLAREDSPPGPCSMEGVYLREIHVPDESLLRHLERRASGDTLAVLLTVFFLSECCSIACRTTHH